MARGAVPRPEEAILGDHRYRAARRDPGSPIRPVIDLQPGPVVVQRSERTNQDRTGHADDNVAGPAPDLQRVAPFQAATLSATPISAARSVWATSTYIRPSVAAVKNWIPSSMLAIADAGYRLSFRAFPFLGSVSGP